MGFSLRPLGRRILDIFNADTQADQQRRIAAGQPRYYAQQQAAIPRPASRPAPSLSMRALPKPIPRPQGNPNVNVGSFWGSGLIEDFLNSPNKVGAGVSDIAAGRYKQGIGKVVTGLGEGPAGLIPVGRVAQVGLKGGSKLLPRVTASAKFGAKQGAGFSAAYGGGAAASQNADYGDILKSAVVGGGVGLVGGAALGGGLPVAGAGTKRFLTANQIGAVGKNVGKPKVSLTEVGVTPFRGTPVRTIAETQPYTNSPRYKGFENSIPRVASQYGHRVGEAKRTTGVWEGSLEPSFNIKLKNTNIDSASPYASHLGRAGNQDAVILFQPRVG